MLRIFLSVLVLSSVKGFEEIERYLDAPKLVSVSAVEPEGMYVEWEAVRERMNDPVIGYKIKLYEIPESSTDELKLVNGERSPGLEFGVNVTHPTTREVIIHKKGKTATIDKIKYNTLYEVRILAFKVDVDGPLSEPMRIKIIKEPDYDVIMIRTLNGCQISVPTESVNLGEDTYPTVYNSYF